MVTVPPPYPYPKPRENSQCHCRTRSAPMFCFTGHLTECHYPMNCKDAACSHLEKYGFGPADLVPLRQAAVEHRRRYGYHELEDSP